MDIKKLHKGIKIYRTTHQKQLSPEKEVKRLRSAIEYFIEFLRSMSKWMNEEINRESNG